MSPCPNRTPPTSPAQADWAARYRRLHNLYQVSQIVPSSLDPLEALQSILRQTVRLTRASSGSVVLINPNSGFLEIQAAHKLPAKATQLKLKVGEGITGWVAGTGIPLSVGDVRQDPRYLRLRHNVRSELAVPLFIEGDLRGVLNVDSTRLNAFDNEDQSLLVAIAEMAAKVIHNTWRFEQMRLKASLFESLISVSQIINSTLGVDDALRVITREACQLMDAQMCSLLMLDETREWLELRACHGAGPAYIAKPRLNLADSLLGVVVRRNKPLQVENVQISSRYQNVEVARREGLVSLLSVPLGTGPQTFGVLSVYTGQIHHFSNEEIRILSALAGLSAIAIDKARLYERFVDMEDQLRQSEKLSALGLLAAEVAHEIRNPLTVMKMLHHSLSTRFTAEDPLNQDFTLIGEKMDHLNKIVDQILDFARSTEPQLKPLHLDQLIQGLGLLIRHKLHQQKIEWHCRFAPDLPLIMGDSLQLEQAFLNLILNAVEAMPAGGSLTIRVQPLSSPPTAPDPTYVSLEFSDTGEGMSKEQCHGAWTSLLKSKKRSGTGLGLAIVARVIEAHRGEIRVKSRPNHGTTFSILLPACLHAL